mmetsp:Transcript_6715/g.11712  ORF Transcript_6715/g.11712 Transcript_6715/m.11712 type:complete len:384 (+) Transcript_6715:266-1417(+)|eukprot:CAMPEP_0168594058 /NCGR_PEP_ID=MMETSP0420-20121227/8678_1 /TAXON_ID=498008 /ORGANISM="Pessonella sp." /LENGTH=383 /DNA_ID=CAMNT_0008630317 /DNA_START=128 /DNA_END=1279 /DNA_ORIENTATION=-
MSDKKVFRTAGAAAKQNATAKGGGGGKYTWGVAGVNDLNFVTVLDRNDPNYDSAGEDEELSFNVVALDPQEAFKKGCADAIEEYFNSEDTAEAAESLHELDEPVWAYEFVKQAIVLSLDKSDRERELAARLLSSLYGSVLPATQISAGFRLVLQRTEDLALDSPNAAHTIGTFLARAVIDDILAPAFLKQNAPNAAANEALKRASALLNDGKRAGEQIESIWGGGEGRSVSQLKKALSVAVEEYLDGGDVAEMERTLRELNVPHFLYQLVKQVIYVALNKDNEKTLAALSSLLASLAQSGLLSNRAILVGFQACIDNVAELKKDYPDAKRLLEDFAKRAAKSGYLPDSFVENAPKTMEQRLQIDAEQTAALAAAIARSNEKQT